MAPPQSRRPDRDHDCPPAVHQPPPYGRKPPTIIMAVFAVAEALGRIALSLSSAPREELATKQDIHQLEEKIMAKLEELIAASTTLSTASDGLSVKLDTLVAKVDAVITSLQNADLPAEGEAALTALKASRDQAAAAGDKVDAEVAKLDTVLPTPAPAGPTS